MRRKDDEWWKVVLQEVFIDLIIFALPGAEKELDINRGVTFLDKELASAGPEGEMGLHIVDKLGKVYRKNGRLEWVLVHVEVQEKDIKENPFPARMFRYYYRLHDLHQKPITAIAIFTGKHGRKIPNIYSNSFLGTSLDYRYNALYLHDMMQKDLEESDNPFAVVALAARAALLDGEVDKKALLAQKILIAKQLFSKGFSNEKTRAILEFLDQTIRISDSQMNRIFKEHITSLDKNNVMGIDEYMIRKGERKGEKRGERRGEKKGILKTKESAVREMLLDGKLSRSDISKYMNVPTSFVNKIKENLAH